MLRGQGGNIVGGVPAVASYLDEVPLPGQTGGPGLFYDLENVQVLKGAQGTLFGRNSTGGAILFQTAMPTNTSGGFIQAGLGNYRNREATGAINLPIVSDQILARVAFNFQDRKGYTRALSDPVHPNGVDLDDRNIKAMRGTLTIKPTEAIRNDTVIDYYRFRNNGNNVILTEVNPAFFTNVVAPIFGPDTAAVFLQQFQGLLSQQRTLGKRTQLPVSYAPTSKRSLAIVNRTTIELTDNLTLKNIFAYVDTKSRKSFDGDGTSIPHADFDNVGPEVTRQFTNELQLQGKLLDDRLKFTLGAFYLKVPKSQFSINDRRTFFGVADSQEQSRFYESSEALFGQASYELVDGVSITGGLRYTKDRRSSQSRGLVGIGAAATCATPPFPPGSPQYNAADPCLLTKTAQSNQLTGNLSVDYQITPRTLVYVAVRKGYRAGGPNGQTLLPENGTFDPEKLTEFEVGLKSDFEVGNVPARTNIAVYHGRVKGLQIPNVIVESARPTTAIAVVQNVPNTSKVSGAELEATLRPAPGLTLGASGAYMKFDADLPPGLARAGTPKFSGTANATYEHELADAGSIVLSTSYDWRSKYLISPSRGRPSDSQSAFGYLNASLEWKHIFGSQLSATLFGTNLLNKTASFGNYGLYDQLGYVSQVYAEPRIYGLRARFDFK